MAFEDTLRQFLTELERLDDTHAGMRDSDVQEYVWETLAYYLIHMQDTPQRPTMYGLTTREADEALAAAVNRFITNARRDPALRNLAPDARLERLQDASVETESGSVYSDFLGHHSVPGPVIEMVEARFQDSPYYREGAAAAPAQAKKVRVNPVVMAVSLGITLLIGIGILVMIYYKMSGDTKGSGAGTGPRTHHSTGNTSPA
ncbi:hypothetical protein DB346_18280 [Verrucomicrobia bacterium LW23]|nr:hypothetical protein DB346_18280 [Verrucomicrobia bacterium LW23]